MGILRSDLIAHSQLTSANASVLFDGGDGNAGSTGLKTADSGNKYEIQSDIGELTIECWIYCTSIEQTFDTIWATNNYGVSGNSANFYQHYDGIYFTISGLASDLDIRGLFEANKWYHVATTRKWSASKSTHQWRIYVDGEIVGYAETSQSITEGVLCIGANNYGSAFPAFEFAGYISNFRMCKRVLYKEKFTPSKFKLKDVSGTVLLCCQDASDDTAVTVGDTLTAGGSPTPGGFGPDLKEDIADIGPVFADNTKFDTLSYMVPPGGTTTQSNRGRAVFAGGYSGGPSPAGAQTATMSYAQIQSMGNVIDFGDLTAARWIPASGASSTRGTFNGGATPTRLNTIDYVTIATTSNATNFGDLTTLRTYHAGFSSSTRAISGGGNDGSSNINTIDYITIASAGNATDFGDMLEAKSEIVGDCSPTRGLFMGGTTPTKTATVDYITIATAGNEQAFGDLSVGTAGGAALSSNTRAIYAGGGRHPSDYSNNIGYFTIASLGNETDFGDLTGSRTSLYSGTSNNIRGVVVGGFENAPVYNVNTIDFITIASTGNSSDFGDITTATRGVTATSDSHGGIS